MSKCKVNLKRKAQKLKAYADIPLMCPVSFFCLQFRPCAIPAASPSGRKCNYSLLTLSASCNFGLRGNACIERAL